MASHGQVAARVRADKDAHPERYCPERRCLWRLSSGPCPRHPAAVRVTVELVDRRHDRECNVFDPYGRPCSCGLADPTERSS
jgi:hypothetical protein